MDLTPIHQAIATIATHHNDGKPNPLHHGLETAETALRTFAHWPDDPLMERCAIAQFHAPLTRAFLSRTHRLTLPTAPLHSADLARCTGPGRGPGRAD